VQSKAAIIVALEPSSEIAGLGQAFPVDLVVSGLGSFAPPSLGAFSFDLNYDPGVLAAVSLSFGNALDLGFDGSIQFSDLSVPGLIHLDEVSLENPGILEVNQGSDLTLATLVFSPLQLGSAFVDFGAGSLSDELGASLEFTTQAARFRVSDSGSTAWLLPLGLVGLLGLARRTVVS
jgi:hypothetical protein